MRPFLLGVGCSLGLIPILLALAVRDMDAPPPSDDDRDRVVVELNNLSTWVGFDATFSRRGVVLVMDGADFCSEDTIQRLPGDFGALPTKAGFQWFACFDGSHTIVVEVTR